MELMNSADGPGLEALVASDRRAVRHLLGRVWDPQPDRRKLAARTLGEAAVAHPELTLDVIRRLLWALNDESATNGVHAVAALGEIGRRNPQLIKDFVQPMAALLWDDSLRTELLRALLRIVESSPDISPGLVDVMAAGRENYNAEDRRLSDRILHVMAGGQNAS